MDGRLAVELPEVFAGGAQWAASAASFADVVPPVIASTWPSAVAVGAIHADVTTSHAQFGARLAQTAAATQLAGTSYVVMDIEQNAKALAEVIGDAVQS
jgi:hypothetical protein